MDLPELRARIDRTDDAILGLLDERARLVLEVSKLKDSLDVPFHDPAREREVVARLEAASQGPFPREGVRHVFNEVVSACRALGGELRAAYLGPEGTFSHEAAGRRFGRSARLLACGTVEAALAEVDRGGADVAVVPIESQEAGVVASTLDAVAASNLKITAEVSLLISHALLARAGTDLGRVERVLSHPQALAQCRRWLGANLPRAALVETPSTAEAARRAASEAGAGAAAIASEPSAPLFGLAVLRSAIEDAPGGITRFLVLGGADPAPTGRDRTSLLVDPEGGPAGLAPVLSAFASRGVAVASLATRPSHRVPFETVAFVDVVGHAQDATVAAAIEAARATAEIRVLGSYPRA